MDPGNWATDIEAGSRYGYSLLFVVVLSSLAAMALQCLSMRLGIATGRDLAQLSRRALLAACRALSVAARRTVDRGLRSGRSARRRAGFPSALQMFADHRRVADRVRHADRARPEGQEFPRSRSDHAGADRDDRRRLHHRTGAGEAALAVGRARADSFVAGAQQPRADVSGDRHSRRDRDAAQPLSAFVDRADPRGEARLGQHPLGDRHVAHRYDRRR